MRVKRLAGRGRTRSSGASEQPRPAAVPAPKLPPAGLIVSLCHHSRYQTVSGNV